MAFYKIIKNGDELVDVLEFKTDNGAEDYCRKHVGYSYERVKNKKRAERLRIEIAERKQAGKDSKLSDILNKFNDRER